MATSLSAPPPTQAQLDDRIPDASVLHLLKLVSCGGPTLTSRELERLESAKDVGERFREFVRSPDCFLTLHRSTPMSWYRAEVTSKGLDRAAAVAAMETDPRVSRKVANLVPRLLTERAFWEHYLSHVLAFRTLLLSRGEEEVKTRVSKDAAEEEDDVALSSNSGEVSEAFVGVFKDEFFQWQVNVLETQKTAKRQGMARFREAPDRSDASLVKRSSSSLGQTSEPSALVEKLLDFGAPRALDVLLDSFDSDRTQWPSLLSGEEWVELVRVLTSLTCQAEKYMVPVQPLELGVEIDSRDSVASERFRRHLADFVFRFDRDPRAWGALRILSGPTVERVMGFVVPVVCTETLFYSNILGHLAMETRRFMSAKRTR